MLSKNKKYIKYIKRRRKKLKREYARLRYTNNKRKYVIKRHKQREWFFFWSKSKKKKPWHVLNKEDTKRLKNLINFKKLKYRRKLKRFWWKKLVRKNRLFLKIFIGYLIKCGNKSLSFKLYWELLLFWRRMLRFKVRTVRLGLKKKTKKNKKKTQKICNLIEWKKKWKDYRTMCLIRNNLKKLEKRDPNLSKEEYERRVKNAMNKWERMSTMSKKSREEKREKKKVHKLKKKIIFILKIKKKFISKKKFMFLRWRLRLKSLNKWRRRRFKKKRLRYKFNILDRPKIRQYLNKWFEKIRPRVALFSKRKGTSMYELPRFLPKIKSYKKAVQWFVKDARLNKRKMLENIVLELYKIYKRTGIIKKRRKIARIITINEPFFYLLKKRRRKRF